MNRLSQVSQRQQHSLRCHTSNNTNRSLKGNPILSLSRGSVLANQRRFLTLSHNGDSPFAHAPPTDTAIPLPHSMGRAYSHPSHTISMTNQHSPRQYNHGFNTSLQSAILSNRFFVSPSIGASLSSDASDGGMGGDREDHGDGSDHDEDEAPSDSNNDTDNENDDDPMKPSGSGMSLPATSASAASRSRTPSTVSAQVLFDLMFEDLVQEYGLENLYFPKDIMWLAGAPGSGKGIMTKFISDQIGNTNPPIMMSEILEGASIEASKATGDLVNDRVVLRTLFQQLLNSTYQTGVIVDGFPRTAIQAECIKLLFDKMLWLRRHFEGTEFFKHFRRPVFHVTVLYVEEKVSIERQLRRGQQAIEKNRIVRETGVGDLTELRQTDLSEELASARYKNFYNNMYTSLQIVKEKFPFHFINAEKTQSEVQASIIEELQYQSKNELADETYDNVRRIPLASEIKVDARHELVRRLDAYQRDDPKLFNKVIQTLNEEFFSIVKRQALSGHVIIRTENPTFFEWKAIDMALDLLSERGYRVVLDYLRNNIVKKIDLETGMVAEYDRQKTLVFNINFPPPKIRHAVQKSTQWETTIW